MNWFKRLFSRSPAPKRADRPRSFSFAYQIPTGLGIRQDLADAARGLLERQESSLKESYMRQVQDRVMSRHPDIGQAKYGWMELEIRRFFLLTALVKSVPMYSNDADLVWHEMLMFTREYQQFCDEFTGFYIHHQPNVSADTSGASGPEMLERDIFELIYASLFDLNPENQKLLGLFHRRKTDPGLMEELRTMDPARVRAVLRFRETSDPVVGTLQAGVISVILDKMEQARFYHSESHLGRKSSFYGGVDPLWTIMAFGLATQMSSFDPAMEAEEEERRQDGSSCSGYHGGTDDGSNDSGSSSCSSSDSGGSSCGSGCGGGGD